jgi:predicted dehydrogenase
MKVGIVGTGGMGSVHARAYAQMPDVELFGFDRNEERLSAVMESTVGTTTVSVKKLIEAVDIVDICLPTDMHESVAVQAMEAGKTVYCEKPLARTLDSARSMVTTARKLGVRFGVGQVVRYFPEFRRAHDLVVDGAVGKSAAVRTHRGGSAPTGSESWFMDHSRSGGVLVDLAIHDFDWLRWTFGEVKSVVARSVAAKKGRGPDYALAVLTHESGTVSHVEATWMDPAGFSTAFEIAGSEGLLNYDSRAAASLQLSVAGKTSYEANLTPTDEPYYLELRAFLDAVGDGSAVPVGIEEGFHALAISLAALQSAETGKACVPERL